MHVRNAVAPDVRGRDIALAAPPAPLVGVRVRPGEARADAGTADRRGEARSGWRDAVRAEWLLARLSSRVDPDAMADAGDRCWGSAVCLAGGESARADCELALPAAATPAGVRSHGALRGDAGRWRPGEMRWEVSESRARLSALSAAMHRPGLGLLPSTPTQLHAVRPSRPAFAAKATCIGQYIGLSRTRVCGPAWEMFDRLID